MILEDQRDDQAKTDVHTCPRHAVADGCIRKTRARRGVNGERPGRLRSDEMGLAAASPGRGTN